MAEMTQGAGGAEKPKKIRSRKLNAKVDLTAMVDLAFLLITFFMLTTSLSKPASMDLAMPDTKGAPQPVDENRTMTILIGGHNKTQCFMGTFAGNKPKEITLGTRDLRREIAARKKEALAYSAAKGNPEKGLVVIIKPGNTSNYGNLVDVLDEMAIADVPTYAIADADPKEKDFLQRLP